MRLAKLALIPLVFVLCGVAGPRAWAESKVGKKHGGATKDDLFEAIGVTALKLEIPPSYLNQLKGDPKTYVKGILREESQAYENAGIRYKGGTGSPAAAKKPSFTIKLNEFNSDLRFHGQRKFVLENSLTDASFLGEMLANDLFRAAGVPAPRCSFARVELNGGDLGLYVVTEGVNRDFLAHHFEKSKGNLYEGDSNDVTDKLDKDSGEDAKDESDLAALVEAVREPDLAKRWQRLDKVLDLPRFLSFAAMEVILWNTEGYCLSAKKYRIYHDPITDRLVFLPHRAEQLFAKPEGEITPPMGGLVAKAMLETPEGRQQYQQTLAKLVGSVMKVDRLNGRITEWMERIRPVLARGEAGPLKAFDEAVVQLRTRLVQRVRFLEQKTKR